MNFRIFPKVKEQNGNIFEGVNILGMPWNRAYVLRKI